MLIQKCFPFLARLFQCSLQLHHLSNTPGEVAEGEQEKGSKPWLCLSSFGDPFIGPSSEHEKHSSLTLQNLPAVQHFLQNELMISNSERQKLCEEMVAISFLENFCQKYVMMEC